jgi:hypothetical protein
MDKMGIKPCKPLCPRFARGEEARAIKCQRKGPNGRYLLSRWLHMLLLLAQLAAAARQGMRQAGTAHTR